MTFDLKLRKRCKIDLLSACESDSSGALCTCFGGEVGSVFGVFGDMLEVRLRGKDKEEGYIC